MIMDSRVHAAPYSHCLHHIIFELFDLKVFMDFFTILLYGIFPKQTLTIKKSS